MFLGQYVGVRSATFWVITPLMGTRQTRFRKVAQEVETPTREELLKCTPPALAIASNQLIELVDRVMERHPHKGNFRSRPKLFPWLRRDLVRPSMNRPSQKINYLLSPEPSARLMQKADGVTHPSCQPEAA